MKLYFLRHGEANWPNWEKPDDERPLTKKGKKEVREIAEFLCDLKLKLPLILTSPLPRALETAEIVAERLDVELKQEPGLAKGFGVGSLRAILKRTKAVDLMIVGHEPGFSAVIRHLTGGKVKIGKAGVARVDLEDPDGDGRLIWLVPPRIAKL